MESIIEEILHIKSPSRGDHHPSTIAFWSAVQKELEKGKTNKLANYLSQIEYATVRRAAYVGSNRTPCNEIQICSTEDATNGNDT